MPATLPGPIRAFGLCHRDNVQRSPTWLGIGMFVIGVMHAPEALATPALIGEVLAFDSLDRRRDSPPNEEPYYRGDGVYGRFDGELALLPAVGMNYNASGWSTELALSGYYLNTIGVVFRHNEGRWSPIAPRADFTVSSLSLAVRPLFLLRWSQNLEQGPSFLDLLIDSLTLSVGSYWSQQHSLDRQRYGLETELSVGFPLLGRAHGPWLTASVANRMPKVTNADNRIDMVYGLRFEWSFSLGN